MGVVGGQLSAWLAVVPLMLLRDPLDGTESGSHLGDEFIVGTLPWNPLYY